MSIPKAIATVSNTNVRPDRNDRFFKSHKEKWNLMEIVVIIALVLGILLLNRPVTLLFQRLYTRHQFKRLLTGSRGGVSHVEWNPPSGGENEDGLYRPYKR